MKSGTQNPTPNGDNCVGAKTELIPSTPQHEAELLEEIKHYESELQVIQQLGQYARLTQHITGRETADRDWYFIRMMPDEKKVYENWYTIERFPDDRAQSLPS